MVKKKLKNILIVDDDTSIRGVTKSILESAGYRVETAETAGSALKELRKHQYDLLVLDIGLPGKMAMKLCQTLKKSSRYFDIPILFMLGFKLYGELEYEKQKVVEGGYVYIRKPFKAKEFLANVSDLLEKQPDKEKSPPIEVKNSSPGMFRLPWRRQPMTIEGSVNSERKLSK